MQKKNEKKNWIKCTLQKSSETITIENKNKDRFIFHYE